MYHLSHERLYSNLKYVHFLSVLSYDNPYLVKLHKFSYQAEHVKTLKDQKINCIIHQMYISVSSHPIDYFSAYTLRFMNSYKKLQLLSLFEIFV